MARITANYCPIKDVIDVAIANKPTYAHYAPTGKHTFALCLISAPGKIESIEVPNEVHGDPDTFMLKIISPIGTVIKRPPLGNDIIGFLGVMGDSRQESEDKAMTYSQRVNVTTR